MYGWRAKNTLKSIEAQVMLLALDYAFGAGVEGRVVVPAGMAYGETGGYGSERKINPHATLVYEVELLDILAENEAAPHLVWGI